MTLAEILKELDIELIPTSMAARKPGQTCAGRILQRLLDDEGEAHLRSVLISITQSTNNKHMLIRAVILAVSDVLRTYPTWFGGTWLDAFDKIDLEDLYLTAKRDRDGVPPRYAICARIIDQLRPKLDPEPFSDLFRRAGNVD